MDFKINDEIELVDNTDHYCIGHKFKIKRIDDLAPEYQILVGDKLYYCVDSKEQDAELYNRDFKLLDVSVNTDPNSLRGKDVIIIDNTRRDRHRLNFGDICRVQNVSPYSEYGGEGQSISILTSRGRSYYVNRQDIMLLSEYNAMHGTNFTFERRPTDRQVRDSEVARSLEIDLRNSEEAIRNMSDPRYLRPEHRDITYIVGIAGSIEIELDGAALAALTEVTIMNTVPEPTADIPSHTYPIGTEVQILTNAAASRWAHNFPAGSRGIIVEHYPEPEVYRIDGIIQIVPSSCFRVVE